MTIGQGQPSDKNNAELRLPKAGTIEIVPSILDADFGRLADEIAVVASAGVRVVHLDVMDGHFVPNITIGPPVIAKLRQHSDLVFDSHLMISEPEKYTQRFIDAGADHITFHIEVAGEPEKLIDKLHEQGLTAGICLNPETPVESIEKIAPLCDMVLVMTVHPGFGGQAFIESTLEKITAMRKKLDEKGLSTELEVDGGINVDIAPRVVKAGADVLVAGAAVFNLGQTVKEAIQKIRNSLVQ